ncbi:chemotaxis protein CheW, partial [Variovorax sp. MHTC-1]|uniref:chemotaxis protein CheW n=1 Tax=Variovorax sp. MHTC-1 TaxID=2495593 RepID=UPI00163CF48C
MAEITSLHQHASAPVLANANRLEVVTFTLGEEEYGIDIQKVQELRGYDAVTRI